MRALFEAEPHEQTLALKHEHVLDYISLYGTTIIFTLAILAASAQIMLRLVLRPLGFDYTLAWTISAARILFVIGVYWGASVASRNSQHIKITYFRNLLKEHGRASRLTNILTFIFSSIFLLVALYGFIIKASSEWHATPGGLQGIPIGLIYSAIALGFAVTLYYESSSFFHGEVI